MKISMEGSIDLLDHGYVRLIETWGSDQRIVEAARMSTDKGFQGWGRLFRSCLECDGHGCGSCSGGTIPVPHHTFCQGLAKENTIACEYTYPDGETCQQGRTDHVPGDEKLLKYLIDNHHDTPFEMAGMVLEIQAPIFVFREWHRHRTQSYNELSARYTPMPNLNYVPTVGRLMRNAGGTNKQAGTVTGSEVLTESRAEDYINTLMEMYRTQQLMYEKVLGLGVPKELARLHLPVGRYSRMRASANLRNWLAFLTLRMAPNAQWEIQEYARAVAVLVKEKFPVTWELVEKRIDPDMAD